MSRTAQGLAVVAAPKHGDRGEVRTKVGIMVLSEAGQCKPCHFEEGD
jgi:hypothetical protein